MGGANRPMIPEPKLSSEFAEHVCNACADDNNLKPVMILYQFKRACDVCNQKGFVSHIRDYGRPEIKVK